MRRLRVFSLAVRVDVVLIYILIFLIRFDSVKLTHWNASDNFFRRFFRFFLWIFYSICCSVKWHWFLSLNHRLTFQINCWVEIFEISQSHTVNSRVSVSHIEFLLLRESTRNFNFMQSPHAVCTMHTLCMYNYNIANCNNQMWCTSVRWFSF